MQATVRLDLLCHHRWSAGVLAELHRGGGGAKFVTLERRLGIPRDSLSRTLAGLRRLRLVARNRGYGHPMRPEYLLTAAGARLAPACARLVAFVRRAGIEEQALRKWSLPVTLALSRGAGRFGEVRDALPGITARALTLAFVALESADLVERRVTEGRPPGTAYRLTRRGRRLAPAVSAVAT